MSRYSKSKSCMRCIPAAILSSRCKATFPTCENNGESTLDAFDEADLSENSTESRCYRVVRVPEAQHLTKSHSDYRTQLVAKRLAVVHQIAPARNSDKISSRHSNQKMHLRCTIVLQCYHTCKIRCIIQIHDETEERVPFTLFALWLRAISVFPFRYLLFLLFSFRGTAAIRGRDLQSMSPFARPARFTRSRPTENPRAS